MMEKCFDEGTLQAFLDNELSHELSQRVARHVADCDPCAITLAEVEEETAFAFAALEQEFNTLVPTQRLWSKINESIEVQQRKRGFWQHVSGLVSGFSFTNPHIIAFGSLLLIVGVVSTLIIVKNDISSGVALQTPQIAPPSVTRVNNPAPTVDVPGTTPAEEDGQDFKEPSPQYRAVKTDFRKEEKFNRTEGDVVTPPIKHTPVVSQYVDGEESYVDTIARLEKTVNENKDEVLKPSQRFTYEKDMAVVNDTIKKMREQVKKNPKNQDAKQILFASYQNKIELLNSVTQRGELMASLR
jgi:ribosomal protein S15P/S13E